jgi:hypothetical protein
MTWIKASVFLVVLTGSAICHAWGGGYHGGGYGGGGYYHGHGGYYHGGHGYYRGGSYYGPGVVIGVPFGNYYGPSYAYPPPICETVRICNQFNECWLEQECN